MARGAGGTKRARMRRDEPLIMQEWRTYHARECMSRLISIHSKRYPHNVAHRAMSIQAALNAMPALRSR